MLPNSNGNFTGKVAFVTGAAKSIGRARALAFVQTLTSDMAKTS
ncbi:hypothetical protein COO91_00305 [Nostoc flagelliforme CCNUN1]|uniref:Uncharacterized protein n=1 Tax=Nostoc flagelliforme CCNUN1 TaxID=2038116 RepID=A0A2K8SG98_9NOSO|nr:hypothetical protein [Nostoc flagelliforme]AUB34482.1 hypothetical protein COO91_00305 [Nostoc flagelliforme CCNUN1]